MTHVVIHSRDTSACEPAPHAKDARINQFSALAEKRAAAVDARLSAIGRDATGAEERLRRLYQLVEDGVAGLDDLLKDRIATLKSDRDRSREALARARGNMRFKAEVTEPAIAKFGELMRSRLMREDTPDRKAMLRSIIERIEVDDGKVRILGRKEILGQCFIAGSVTGEGVRTFVPKWRTGQDETANSYVIEIAV